jgi:hypothetical protein
VQLLTASDVRLVRLQFLAEHRKQEKVPLYHAINLSEARFVERFPLYAAWVHKRKVAA